MKKVQPRAERGRAMNRSGSFGREREQEVGGEAMAILRACGGVAWRARHREKEWEGEEEGWQETAREVALAFARRLEDSFSKPTT